MLLTRVQNIEQLRHIPPGEFGKLIGLDRISEARCLRSKMKTLADDSGADKWAAYLASFWMEKYADTTGFLYVDGHVKIYGGKTRLPLRYVSRQRLCLKGISFYWINDALGQPFFVIEKQIDSGMLDALRTDIIPRLLKDISNQPSEQELQNDPELFRFILVFDREGASPAFFKEVWGEYRIACLTYRKNPTVDWPEDEFENIETKTINNEPVTMKLAERSTTFGKEISVEVKEVRKLCESGHQTAIITTAKSLDTTVIASQMFTTTADLEPDERNSSLNIYLHTASTPAVNRWLVKLFEQLNQTETVFPGTSMKMVFHSLATQNKHPNGVT